MSPFPSPPGADSSAVPEVDVNVVCAILKRDDRFLVARRPAGKRLAGLWEFPGGKVEAGEAPEEALHRELAEELGCSVCIDVAGPHVVHAYEWGSIRLLPFVCHLEVKSPEPFAHEHSELAWFFQKDFTSLEWAPADLPVIEWLKNLPANEAQPV